MTISPPVDKPAVFIFPYYWIYPGELLLTAKLECVRAAPRDLKDHFRTILRRRVNKDRTIMVQNRLFEAPVALVGERVEVLFHESSPEEIEVKHKQKSYGYLAAVDLHINSRIKRDKNNDLELIGEGDVPESGKLWEDE